MGRPRSLGENWSFATVSDPRHHDSPAAARSAFPTKETTILYDTAVQARRREFAAAHVMFKLVEYVEQKHPGLLDFIESSLDHLGDPVKDDSKDNEAVREIARKLIASARREGHC